MREILTPVQIRITREMMENTKNNYIPLIKDGKKKQEVEEKYSIFSNTFSSFIASLKEDVYNRKQHNKALSTPKIDPYIAGGAASAIAGPVGGVYAATSTSINNSNISAARNYWQMETINSKVQVNSTQGKLLKYAKELDDLLNEFPEVHKKREEVKENDYQKALADYKSFSYKKVRNSEQLFKGLLDYSDSVQYAAKATNKKTLLSILFYEGTSAAIAILLPIIIGIYGHNFAFGMIITWFCFIISEVSLRINFKLDY